MVDVLWRGYKNSEPDPQIMMNGGPKEMQTLTVLSWNVNGFTQKKTNVLNHLKPLQADVVFLQETHIGPSANSPSGAVQIQSLEQDYDWAVYTVFKRSCRGVAILFRSGLGCEGLQVVGDEKGRYMIISCKIQEQEFVFVNVYNPNEENIDFNKFKDSLTAASKSTYFIVGGDFNTVMDAEADKTSNNRNRGHKDRFKGLENLLESFSLVDVWRWLYPEEKSFTYFDGKGKSRLDYFFLPVQILTNVISCKIHKRPQYLEREGCISDHAPITIQIQLRGLRWQFCSGFLEEEGITEHLSTLIKNFSGAKWNKRGDLWPALKVRVACETRALNKSGQNIKQQGELTEVQTSSGSSQMQTVQRKCLSGSERHIQILPQFWSEASHIEEYLTYLHETQRFEEVQVTLNTTLTEPVSKMEILSAILSLCNTDHFTPDGLPLSFYKHFASKITDLLQAFFNQILDLQSIRCVVNESDTFPTPALCLDNTDHTYCTNVQHYSPVTIFNVDYNILALILAGRLDSIMGYILNRRKIILDLSTQDFIYALERIGTELPVLIISVSVDPGELKWPYLFHRLNTIKLPDRFKSVVTSLMSVEGGTKDCVCSAHTLHDPVSLGLKVGCPLTPLLISICLLPLIHSVNEDTRLQGIRIGGEYIKSVLDKDRVVIFLSNTGECLKAFEMLLQDFLKNSGFMIDSRFSEVFVTGHSGLKKETLPSFRRTHEGFWYKGSLVAL